MKVLQYILVSISDCSTDGPADQSQNSHSVFEIVEVDLLNVDLHRPISDEHVSLFHKNFFAIRSTKFSTYPSSTKI